MSPAVRIGVVDDDPDSRDRVSVYLERFAREQDQPFDVHLFTDGADFVDRFRSDLDVVFLDVQMPQMDGLEAAREVRALDADLVIVFLTNMVQYAVKGYEVDALGYLVKPVPYFAFAAELKRALTRVRRTAGESLVLHVPGGIARLAIGEILYIESIKHRMVVHAFDREYAITGTLRAFEEELGRKGFYRSNSGYLVNLRHVTSLDATTCTLTGGRELAVSRTRRRGLLAALSDELGRGQS